MPNRFMSIGPGTDFDAALNQINKNFANLDREAITKVFRGPNGVNALIEGRLPNSIGYGLMLTDPSGIARLLLYFDADGNPVLKISPSGVDVTTATDDQLTFNSAQNVFKIVRKYTLSVPVSNSPGTYTSYTSSVAHGLGSPRAIVGFVDSSLGGRAPTPHQEMFVTGPPGGETMTVGTYKWIEVDNTNVTAHVETTTFNNATYTFTVYLQQETAT